METLPWKFRPLECTIVSLCYMIADFKLHVRFITLSLAVTGLGASWQAASQAPGDGASEPAATPRTTIREAVDGTASCSARGCHGGITPHPVSDTQRIGQNEYTVWISRD